VSAVRISLREITEDNAASVRALGTRPDQERFVSSVVDSLAEAAEVPEANPWVRAVYADDLPVWKLLIDYRHQRLGYGQEVMRQIVELIRKEGATELLTSYALGDGSPASFYESLGFLPTGAIHDGEVLARLPLDQPLPSRAS
jgi:GNAT superfamily N-acetyltransferase